MNEISAAARAEFETLDWEYQSFVGKTRADWLRANRPISHNVYEVMSGAERQEVNRCIVEWERYITPIAEEWWRSRGYSVVWPDDNSKPIKLQKLAET